MECQFCHKEFKRPCGLAIHERTCKDNPNRKPLENHVCNFRNESRNGGWKCSVCGLNFRVKSELTAHRKTHPKILFRVTLSKVKENRKCKFCGLEKVTTKEGMTNHERYCTSNPNRCEPSSHPVSEETKKRISVRQKENYKGRSIFNIDRSQEPFSEKYFREWLEKEHINYKKNFHVDRFFLDFAFPDKKIYFEVNGEQHYRKMYNGRDYQERDKEREYIISQSGWKCVAIIRWSEFRALSLNERSAYLENLKQLII